MPDSFERRAKRFGLEELQKKYPDLRLAPSVKGEFRLRGTLRFSADARGKERIVDEYEIDCSIPALFPNELPTVRETGGRITAAYEHRFIDGTLCLGSPTSLRLRISDNAPLLTFIDRCVVPTLYGWSYFERHGALPFGELKHGADGIRQDLASLFGVETEEVAIDFVRLTSLRKRVANKRQCACRSGKRLGRCHHRGVNMLRKRLRRHWFRHILQWTTI